MPAIAENQALTNSPHPAIADSDPDRTIHGTAQRADIMDNPNAATTQGGPPSVPVDPNAELRAKVAAAKAALEEKQLKEELAAHEAALSAPTSVPAPEESEAAALQAELDATTKALSDDGTEAYSKEGE